jgi:drug/metabolite transporter (DMT)-like permease
LAYPVYATTFIWGMLIAIFWGKEAWAWGQLLGVALIISGVSVIAAFYPR